MPGEPCPPAAIAAKAETTTAPLSVGSFLRARGVWFAAAGLAAAVLFAFADVLRTLVWQWYSNDAYSYGFLIPLISAYLVWARRDKLYAVAVAPRPLLGCAILLFGGGMLLAGREAGVAGLQQLALLVTLVGLVITVLGRAAYGVMALPLGFLILMMPIWDVVTERLHGPFQQFSATIGTVVLRLWGVPVNQEGTYLNLPNISLEVAKVCSGVNYFVAVLALAIPLAWLMLKGGRRILLVAFAMIVALLANALRVALIGFLAYHGLSHDLHGPGHILQGMFVAVIGYAAIFAGLSFLSRSSGPAGSTPAVTGPLTSYTPAVLSGAATVPAAVALAAILPLGLLHLAPAAQAVTSPPLTDAIGEWHSTGPEAQWASAVLQISRNIEWRTYRHPDGSVVAVYIGAYTNAENHGVSGYWTDIFNSVAVPTSIPDPSGSLDANRVVVRRGAQQVQVVYWYVLNNSVTNQRAMAKLYGIGQQVTRFGRTPLVVVVATMPNDTPSDRTLQDLTMFSQELWRLLQNRLSEPTSAEHRGATPADRDPGADDGAS
jgi:EpsI family protein